MTRKYELAKKAAVLILAALCTIIMVASVVFLCATDALENHADRAIITLPNGETITGEVEGSPRYVGDQISVQINGQEYVVHITDIALITDTKRHRIE